MYFTPEQEQEANRKAEAFKKAIERARLDNHSKIVRSGMSVKNKGAVSLSTPPQARASENRALLSTAHIERKYKKNEEKTGKISFWLNGSLLKVSKPKNEYCSCGRGVRGTIKGFSSGSRKRMMQKLAKLDKRTLPVFVTLTYPAEYSKDSKDWKYDLNKFCKRLEYHFPDRGLIWKLEPQGRGAPHYHLMVWGVNLGEMREFVPEAWHKVVGTDDKNHLYWHQGLLKDNEHCVQPMRSWKQTTYYASKYLAKVIEDADIWEEVGRYWGMSGAENIPMAVMICAEISYRQAVQFMRLFRRYAGIKARDYKSLTIFCDNPAFWFDRLDRLLLT